MRNFCYAAFGALVFILGCNVSDLDFDNLKVKNLTSDIAVPFGTASYTFEDLIADIDDSGNWIVDEETGEIHFSYSQSIDYSFTSDLIDVPDTDESTSWNIPDALAGSGAYSESHEFEQPYQPQDDEIVDSVYHENGARVEATVTSTNPAVAMTYVLTIGSTTDLADDSPIVINGTVNGGIESELLDNHVTRLLLNNEGENALNAEIVVTANLGAGEEFNSDVVDIQLEFVSQDFRILFGKFGRDTVDFNSQTLDVSFFQELDAEGIEFGGATMTFDVTSTFGIPIGLGMAGVYGEQDDGTRTYMSGAVITSPSVIQAATLNESTLQPEETQTIIEINSFNSTFGDVLGNSPSSIVFDIEGITNSDDENASNFVTDDATINADISVEVPLEVSLMDVKYTLEFENPGGTDLTELDSLELRLVTVNELPFNAELDMYIMGDTLGDLSVTDTLHQILNKKALDQPFLNFDRTVREPKINVEDIPLGKKGTTELARSEKIIVVVTMNSPESQTSESIYVKLLSTAKIEISLGARGILDTEL